LIRVIHRSRRDLFSTSSFSARSSSTVNDIPVVNNSSCKIYISKQRSQEVLGFVGSFLGVFRREVLL
jgi:hypothetical protein